ncbi:hypothetical protein PsorP6_015648 [Peronosclerospora sorghi]|uniref:Uncharacterized protein n=1 Tax=Peronosclerospora sorghi TaxID=230839 RepID=A0ACC0WPE1_9STRA|nr:hypothetical protein PsorP6_015648 [Peronosclerospora sorghi]
MQLDISDVMQIIKTVVYVMTVEEGQILASTRECPFVECSAEDHENINEVFTYFIKEIKRDSGLLQESDESLCTIL